MVKITRECGDGQERKTLLTIEMWQFVLLCALLMAGLIGWQRAIDSGQDAKLEKTVPIEQYRVDQARMESMLKQILSAVQVKPDSTAKGY